MRKSLKGLVMHEGRYRLSVAHLLVAIVAMFIVLPFVDHMVYGRFVESAFFTVLMLSAVNAVGGRRSMLVAAATLAAPTILMRWSYHAWPGSLTNDLYLLASILFVAFVTYQLLRFVLQAPQVNSEVMCAAIAVYLLLAVVWSFIYTLLERWQPGAFVYTNPRDAQEAMSGFVATYFSVQVQTSITFGDIIPATDVARMLALVQSTSGVFYMAIMVARLVGLYSSQNVPDRS